MWVCPEEVENALWAACEEVVGEGPLSAKRLREAVIERSRLYTSERGRIHEPSDAAGDLAARATFFTVADAPKSMVPVAELEGRGLLQPSLRVLDVGAGCGAMTWGLWAHAGVSELAVHAVDRDRGALQILEGTGRRLGLEVSCEAADASSYQCTESYDLILVGSMLNELSDPMPLVTNLLGSLEPGGSLVIIEPALRDVARRLHVLRDEVLARELATVFAPCVRRQVPCPALGDERDWCHEDRATALPPRAKRLADQTALRRHGMKFSYLVLRKDSASLADELSSAARVVSRVRKLKGKWEAFVCSERGRQRVAMLKRDMGPNNRAFVELVRGDVVFGALDKRIAADAVVRRHRPADSDVEE